MMAHMVIHGSAESLWSGQWTWRLSVPNAAGGDMAPK